MKALLGRGLSIRTTIWLATSYFIVAACGVFLLHQRYEVPWLYTVLALGCVTALVAVSLEVLVASPLERMASGISRDVRGASHILPKPVGLTTPTELRQLWRAQQAVREQEAQVRLAKEGLEARLHALGAEARLLRGANALLAAPEDSLDHVTSMLEDLTVMLELEAVWLVPLRRQAPWPVVGAEGVPAWAPALRPRSSPVWGELLAGSAPALFCLLPDESQPALPFAGRTLAFFPLFHRGRPQGFLLLLPQSAMPAWPPGAWGFLPHVAPALAAALYPYRWPDGRRIVTPDSPEYWEARGEVRVEA
jgi:hypothetical protein